MNKRMVFSLTFGLAFLFSCQNEVPNASAKLLAEKESPETCISNLDLLFFAKEDRLEMWADCPDSTRFIADFALNKSLDFPVGIYTIEDWGEGRGIRYPNAFYQSKDSKLPQQNLFLLSWQEQWPELTRFLEIAPEARLLVFPNDLANGQLEPCFACPHWMAEVYGQLMGEWERKHFKED